MAQVIIMDRRKKWELARRMKKRIFVIKIIDPYSREKVLKLEFVIPGEFDKMVKTLEDFR